MQGGVNAMKNELIQIRLTTERKKSWKDHAEKMGIPLTSLIVYAVSKFINEEKCSVK